MAVNKGDFVRVNFTGKIKDTEEVFDTTHDEIAMEAGIFNENRVFKPIPIIVGGNHLLPDLEQAIIGLDAGDKRTVEVDAENGFGSRDPSLIQTISIKEFKKHGLNPVKGRKIQFEDREGKILSVNSGRVKIDFNHELAGNDLIYDVEVIQIIEDEEEKIKSMIDFHYTNPNMDLDKTEIDITDGVLNIKLDEMAKLDQRPYLDVTIARFKIARDLLNGLDGINKVNFIDSFEEKKNKNSEDEQDKE